MCLHEGKEKEIEHLQTLAAVVALQIQSQQDEVQEGKRNT